MTKMRRRTTKLARSLIAGVTIVAILGPSSLQAQGPKLPSDEARQPHSGVTFNTPTDTPQTTALRLSIARETQRLAERATEQGQKPATGQQSWWTRHKGKVVGIAILATIGLIVFTYIFNHTGD